jgi:hypothetical protein
MPLGTPAREVGEGTPGPPPPTRAEGVVLLIAREHVLRVRDVDSDDIGAFGAEDQALAETIPSHVVEKYRGSRPNHAAAKSHVKSEVHD